MRNDQVRESFGARVRALRVERGWSQESFAHRAELDRTYVSGIERGIRNPTLEVIDLLARTLDVEIRDLFPKGH